MTPLDPSPHSPAAETDDPCVRCGYSLFRIADDQPCPECGLLAERSRRPSEQLRDSRPGYLRRLSIGVWLLLLAAGAWGVGLFLNEPWNQFWRPSLLFGRNLVRSMDFHMLIVPYDVAAVLLLIGTFLLAGRERKAGSAQRTWPLRFVATLPLMYCLLLHGGHELGVYTNRVSALNWQSTRYTSYPPLPPFDAFLMEAERALPLVLYTLVALTAWAVPLVIFRLLGKLGRRLLSRQLHEHCTIVGVGTAATVLIASLGMLGANHVFSESDVSFWSARSSWAIVVVLAISTAATLFLVWSIYLLVRFAVAFAREARLLRRAWAAADRSQERAMI